MYSVEDFNRAEQITFHEKAMENKPVTGGSALAVLLLVLGAVIAFGIIRLE